MIRHDQNNFWIFFFLFISLGCDPEKDAPNNTPDELDIIPPSISLQGIDEVLEVHTTLEISVQDASNIVSTVVMINDQEVLTSSEKQFTYTLNPFEFPNGETTITVSSTDGANNENIQTYSFELKKLLLHYESWGSPYHDGGLTNELTDIYAAINLESTGELVTYKKVLTEDDYIFYAPDEFEEQKIIFTVYRHDKSGAFGSYNRATSIGGVQAGTTMLSRQEYRDLINLESPSLSINGQFNVTIDDVPFPNLVTTLGTGYGIQGISDSPTTFTIGYDTEFTSDVFLYYQNQYTDNPLKEYRYLFIEDFTDQTLKFEELSVVNEEDIINVVLPGLVKKSIITLLGYTNEDNYKNNIFRLLFNSGYRETEELGFSLSYPNFKEYPISLKSLRVELFDGREVQYSMKHLSEIQIPNLSVQQNNDIITIDEEYDFLQLNLDIIETYQGNDLIFKRAYRNMYRESIKNPFDSLVIPSEIMESLNRQGLHKNLIDNSGEMSLTLSRYEKPFDYPNGSFYFPLGKEVGDIIDTCFPLQR